MKNQINKVKCFGATATFIFSLLALFNLGALESVFRFNSVKGDLLGCEILLFEFECGKTKVSTKISLFLRTTSDSIFFISSNFGALYYSIFRSCLIIPNNFFTSSLVMS